MDTPDLGYFLSLARFAFSRSSLPTLPSLSFPAALLFFFLYLLSSRLMSPPCYFPYSLVHGEGHQA